MYVVLCTPPLIFTCLDQSNNAEIIGIGGELMYASFPPYHLYSYLTSSNPESYYPNTDPNNHIADNFFANNPQWSVNIFWYLPYLSYLSCLSCISSIFVTMSYWYRWLGEKYDGFRVCWNSAKKILYLTFSQ